MPACALPPPKKASVLCLPPEEERQEAIDTILATQVVKAEEHLPAAKANLLHAQAKQKRVYRKRRAINPMEKAHVDSLVYLKKARTGGKMESKVEGPYKVMGYNDAATTVYLQDKAERTWAESVARIAPMPSSTPTAAAVAESNGQ